MINIIKLDKYFDDFHVLKEINLNAEKSQIYGLVGSNGCGKTTVMKHIMNIFTQDSGEILYKGISVNEESEHMKEFYYVPDDIYFPHGSTLDSLYEYEKLFYENASDEKFAELVKYFNIDSTKKLAAMSKGQKRQAAFILAMASSPKVLLLDEIVDGLDAVIRRKFWNVLLKEVIDKEMTVIISSHDLKEIENICDKVGIMHKGEVIREEMMEKLKENTKRIQFAVEQEFESIQGENFNLIKSTKIGKVYFAIIEGSVEKFRNKLEEEYKVLLFDELSVNLEEIFITELGGVGYGTEEL